MPGLRLVVLVLGLIATTAAAEPAGERPGPPQRARLATAYLVTVGAFAGSMIAGGLLAQGGGAMEDAGGMLATAGVILAPSAGHWYAGAGVTTGLVLRLSGVAVVGGLVLADPGGDPVGVLIVGGLTAAALWATGVVWDGVTLPAAVRRANASSLRLVPAVTPRGGGLVLTATF